jgi:Domain of unknown function (DUF4351)
MATQHDQLMKELIASFPDQFVRLAAPRLAERMDLEAVAFEPEEHYPGSPTGRERRPDLVSRAHSLPGRRSAENGKTEEAVLHLEIERQYRTATVSRLFDYNRGLGLKYALAVHTLVLYLRGGPKGPQQEVYEERSMGETVMVFHFHSFGLSRAIAAEYLARAEPLAWALAALMRPARGQSRPQLGLGCVRRIAAARGLSRREQDLLSQCVWMYGQFEDDEAVEFDKIIAELEDEEIREMKMSMAEWWKKEAEVSLLKRLLNRRFEQLPSWIDQRLEQASRQELEGWADRVLDAERLEDVFSSA